MRGRRQTGISGRGIVRRPLDFGHRYTDRRQAAAGLLAGGGYKPPPKAAGLRAVAADTSHHQTAVSLRRWGIQTAPNGVNLPAAAGGTNHHPAITEATGLPAMAQAPDRPAMAVSLDRPHNRRRRPARPAPGNPYAGFPQGGNKPQAQRPSPQQNTGARPGGFNSDFSGKSERAASDRGKASTGGGNRPGESSDETKTVGD